MSAPDPLQEYVQLVSHQLRWQKARPVIALEMERHLLDQRDALLRAGLNEAEATAETLRRTGDPVAIGTELDRVHRPKPAWSIFSLIVILLLLGIGIQVFLAGGTAGRGQMIRYFCAIALGGGCLCGAYFLDFTWIGKHAHLLAIGLLLLSVATGIGSPNTFSSLIVILCLLFPLAFAAVLYRFRGRGYLGLGCCLLYLTVASLCCLLTTSGTVLLFVLFCAFALLAAACAWNQFGVGRGPAWCIVGGAALLVLIGGSLFILSNPAVSLRLISALDPSVDPNGAGWLPLVIRETLAGARFWGMGAAPAAASSWGSWLQGVDMDYLLTYLIYRLGWAAFLVIMALFSALFLLGWRQYRKQKSALGRLVSLAVLLTLFCQTAGYVLANLGFPLGFSISLPLLSYGNTALVVNMTLLGMMLSGFRTDFLAKDDHAIRKNAARRWLWQDGKLTISFKKNIAS